MKGRLRFHLRHSLLVALMLVAAVSTYAQDGSQCDYDEQILKGPNPVPPPAQASPAYLIWTPLGRGDQRTAAACPRCMLQHSGLVSWVGQRRVDDQQFAQSTFNAMFPGNYNNPYFPMVFVFGECYGGGMIDDLAGTLTFNPMSIVSASFFNQTASYPVDPVNGGNGTDFIWAYVRALQQPAETAQLAAALASANDPFGWAAMPNPARGNEKLGAETPEYYSQNQGDNITLMATGRDRIILWAGQPNEVDDAQLNQLLLQLVAAPLGFDKQNIIILFASGRPKNGALVQTMKQLYGNDQTHLRQANQKQLDIALQWAFPAGDGPKSSFFFFLAADHGCNNAFQAEPKGGNGGLPIEDGGDWGNGDDDYPPS